MVGGAATTGRVGCQPVSYGWFVGPIPDGLFVLYRCDNPPCVNPEHLFLGTHISNMADMVAKARAVNGNTRKTHCSKGHPFDDVNTYVDPDGKRRCISCKRTNLTEWRRQQRESK